jgi:hypothetical protein
MEPVHVDHPTGPESAMRYRFSIASLMFLVLILAVGFAALRSGSELWSIAVFSMTLVALFIAILGAVYRPAPGRAGWLGFVIFGWGYLVLSFGPGFRAEIRPQLVTAPLLEWLRPRIAPIPPPGEYYVQDLSGQLVVRGPDTADAFRRTGHSLSAVLFGLLGALAARAFASRRVPPCSRDQNRANCGDIRS